MGGIWVPLSYFTVQAEPLRPRGPPGVPVPKPRETTKEETEAWEECKKSKGYLFY